MPIFWLEMTISGAGRTFTSSPRQNLSIEMAASWPCATAQMIFFKVARCAGADWHAPDDWKRKVVEAIERSAHVARVFLLVARADEGWVTIPSYANKNGPPRFEPLAKYEKWLAKPLAVLPASDLLSFVYKKCEQIRNGSDDSGSRKKP